MQDLRQRDLETERRLSRLLLRISVLLPLGIVGFCAVVLLLPPELPVDPFLSSAHVLSLEQGKQPRWSLRPPADAFATLPPLAAQWRRAVVLGRRREIVQGAQALRASPGGREQLLALAADPVARIRAYAIRELGRRRELSLREAFQRGLQDESATVRDNARWALGELEIR